MEQKQNTPTRKKFLFWGLGILSSVAAIKLMIPKKKRDTVKMLTQDGKLVEVDKDLLSARGKKISDTELQTWIKK